MCIKEGHMEINSDMLMSTRREFSISWVRYNRSTGGGASDITWVLLHFSYFLLCQRSLRPSVQLSLIYEHVPTDQSDKKNKALNLYSFYSCLMWIIHLALCDRKQTNGKRVCFFSHTHIQTHRHQLWSLHGHVERFYLNWPPPANSCVIVEK